MKRLLAVAATAFLGAAVLAGPASAAGQLCYDVAVVVNGEAVVAEQACTPIG
jgi:hypothetical protein